MFNRNNLSILPLASRQSKSYIREIAACPHENPPWLDEQTRALIQKMAKAILKAKEKKASIILAYGAHLVKNGLGTIVREMIQEGFITHLATNGAGTIHDWEFAFQGKSEEDVRKYIHAGQFGIWQETGFYINLAILLSAVQRQGYGESIGRLISQDALFVPTYEEIREKICQNMDNPDFFKTGWMNLYEMLGHSQLQSGNIVVNHPFKEYSICEAAFRHSIPLTVHPGFGYDIIYSHPVCSGAAIGIAAEVDFLRFVEGVSHLEGGVYLSVGSSVMSPMILEKGLSMARNVELQKGKNIKNFFLAINDIQEGSWDWSKGTEPAKKDPAYYLRFCKSFARMECSEMEYVCCDNRAFLWNLYHELKSCRAKSLSEK
ncbi:MAG: deoxyhypusine synthase family protein [Candidatus Brocadiae bacterium]|nr:deoxyhypusine synthase family protein [Candidatus Brocadiia bacterium]